MSEAGRSLVERYVLPPAEIEAASLGRVDEALGRLAGWSPDERQVVRRMVYAAGDLSLALLVHLHPEAVAHGVAALRRGGPLVVDVRMVDTALDRRRLAELGCSLRCAIDVPTVASAAQAQNLPRAVVAMRSLAPELDGGVVVIGTAPTALLAVLDLVDAGEVQPALIVGTPVGFTAAAEAKAELMGRSVPYVTVEGTRGGAALAAAATNALLRLATADASVRMPHG
jgi:precorrin-8X/cobalt-precorrin-8 methylmutase